MRILAFLCILNLSGLNAQQVYRSDHFGAPGFEILYGVTDTNLSNELIASGPDLLWDFSQIVAKDFRSAESIPRQEALDFMHSWDVCRINTHTLNISSFNCIPILVDVTHAIAIEDSVELANFGGLRSDRFFKKTDDYLAEVYFLSVLPDLSTTKAGVLYVPPDTTLSFPLEHGSQFSSRTHWSIDLNYFNINVQHKSHSRRIATVDSWGMLITPYDSLHDVLRLRSETMRFDTIIGFGEPILSQHEIEYSWFDTSYGLPVMIARGTVQDSAETISEVLIKADIACQPLQVYASTDTSVYFLDSLGNVTIHFSVDSSNADFYNWSFGDGSGIHQSGGDISHEFDEARTFYVSVQGCLSDCLPLHTCAYKSMSFEIIDTFTTSSTINYEHVYSKVYPNPTTGELIVEVEGYNGYSSYILYDIYGRRVLAGHITSSQNLVDLTALSSGLYSIQLYDGKHIHDSVETHVVVLLQ